MTMIIIKSKKKSLTTKVPEKSVFHGMSEKQRIEYIKSLDELDSGSMIREKELNIKRGM
jgi:hypothetical protein